MKNFTKQKESMIKRYIRFLSLTFIVAFMTTSLAVTEETYVLDLRSNEDFVVLAGATITGIPPVAIKGNVGLSPAAGSYIVGFDGSNVDGILYVVDASGPSGSVINPTLLTTAKGDLTIAYNDAAGRTPVPTGPFLNPGSGNMGGLNLVPGLYKFTSDCLISGSDLTLTGSATDVWIFQIASKLDLASGIKIILAGGAQAGNIFFQVGTSATLGTYSTFKGTILADQSISMGTGASFEGRALAFSGEVTIASGLDINIGSLKPVFSSDSSQARFGYVMNGTGKIDTITVTNTGGADLVIDSVISSNADFTVTPTSGTISPELSSQFYITFSPDSDSLKSGNIYFYHNAENMIDTIPVSGTGVSPIFSVNPTSLSFGNVRNDLTKTDSVTVTNTGTADLIISDITSSNTFFTVDTTNDTIMPDSSRIFYVTFSPLIDGDQNGYIIFNHNAMNPIDSISVSGTGVSPKFSVSPVVLDFGNVINGTMKRDTVLVSNIGSADLIISDITSSNTLFSSCSGSATYTIEPDSSRKFCVSFAPIVDGMQNGKIYFDHNAKNMLDSISATGTGVSPVYSTSDINIYFKDVRTGISKKDSVIITNTGTSDLIITSVISSNTLFTVTPLVAVIKPDSSRKFYVTFAPVVDGMEKGYIYINHNAKNKLDSIFVSGTGVSPKFSVTPRTLNFGNVDNNLTKIDSVTVTNSGTADLIITSITSSNYHYTVLAVKATIKPGLSQTFYITFTPLENALHDGYISFKFNSTKASDSIYVTGNGVGATASPVFSVNPKSLNFGSVNSGSTKMDSVTITNTGNANLTIYSASSSNVYYSADPQIGVILPGASQKVYITFAPLVPGAQNGYIYFYNNAANLKDSIQVSGTGIGTDISPKFDFIANIDFGTVFIGSSKQKSVIVKNVGTSDLIITNVLSSNFQYEITPVIGAIEPNKTEEFFITFEPTIVGQIDAKIVFTHNAGSDTASVTGIGLAEMDVITIKEAITLPIGTEFAIEGVVTRSLGIYTRIQDATAAITIVQSSGMFFRDVEDFNIQMTDKIRVQGSMSQKDFLKVINGNDLTGYQRISRLNALPMPMEVTLLDIANNGEMYESMLITVKGMTVLDVGDINFEQNKIYQVKDESDNSNTVVINIGNSGDTYMDGMPFISESVTFEGVLSQSSASDPNAGYRLTPVLPLDLREETVDVLDYQNSNLYTLYNNSPNPFDYYTTIRYSLRESGFVTLKVLNLLGNEVATLVNDYKEAGEHTVTFYVSGDKLSLENGVYFYRLQTGAFNTTKQMMLVK